MRPHSVCTRCNEIAVFENVWLENATVSSDCMQHLMKNDVSISYNGIIFVFVNFNWEARWVETPLADASTKLSFKSLSGHPAPLVLALPWGLSGFGRHVFRRLEQAREGIAAWAGNWLPRTNRKWDKKSNEHLAPHIHPDAAWKSKHPTYAKTLIYINIDK